MARNTTGTGGINYKVCNVSSSWSYLNGNRDSSVISDRYQLNSFSNPINGITFYSTTGCVDIDLASNGAIKYGSWNSDFPAIYIHTSGINYACCNTATKSGNGNLCTVPSTYDQNHVGQPVTCYSNILTVTYGAVNTWSEDIASRTGGTWSGSPHYPAIYMNCNCKFLI